MLSYTSTPVQALVHPLFKERDVKVFIKREDLNHAFVSGNKWWKLKYNLQEAKRLGHDTLLTFGGAHSNHIYATAAAAKELGLNAVGIIRGEELSTNTNATLQFASNQGMQLHFVTREKYRQKSEIEFISDLKRRLGEFYLIPEGGTNELAIQGVQEFGLQLGTDSSFDFLCCAVGTGGTLAGLSKALPDKKIIGLSSLKGDFLSQEIKRLIGDQYNNWMINNNYHFGGYGKYDAELMNFISASEQIFGFPLEQVYTGKMFYGAIDMIKNNFFPRGSHIMLLHTGGLQGKH